MILEADAGAFIAIVVFLLIVINVIREIMRQAKMKQEQERERLSQPQRSLPPREAKAETPVLRPKPAEKTKDDLQDFLEEIARRTGTTAPQRPVPPPEPPAPRPTRYGEYTRPGQFPVPKPAPKPAPPLPPEQRRPVAQPVRKKAQTVVKTKQPAPGSAPLAAAAAIELEPDKQGEYGAKLAKLISEGGLGGAIVMREVLGPCRAKNPYRLLSR